MSGQTIARFSWRCSVVASSFGPATDPCRPDRHGMAMKVIGFSGYSGSGKTTLVEQLIARLRLAGQRVSVVKHAHHSFDIDQPGKDSWRHRQAGAFEVVIASDRRLAKIRECEVQADPSVPQLHA